MGLLDDLGSALYGAAGSANSFMDDPLGQVKGLLQQRMQEWADNAAANTQAAQMAMSQGPAMRDVGFQKMLDATVNHGGLLAPTVYHGTPHNIQGTYDLGRIGTGEGAQAFGHGIYFAENPATAAAYRDTLGGTDVAGVNTRTAPQGSPEKSAANWVDFYHQTGEQNPVLKAFQQANRSGEEPAVLDILGNWVKNGVKAKTGGNLYSQYLPDEVLPKMLQWDKPLSEQPEAVQQAVQRAGDANFPGWQPPKTVDELIGKNRLDPKTEKWWAQELLKQGIPGLSYLDAGSRGAASQWTVRNPSGGPNSEFMFSTKESANAFIKRNPGFQLIPQGVTMNHVIWDQGLLNQMPPTPVR